MCLTTRRSLSVETCRFGPPILVECEDARTLVNLSCIESREREKERRHRGPQRVASVGTISLEVELQRSAVVVAAAASASTNN